MSQILTLDLNDRVFTAIQQQAQSIGIAPELLAANLLEQKFAVLTGLLTNTEQQAKRVKFESHFGEIDLGFLPSEEQEALVIAIQTHKSEISRTELAEYARQVSLDVRSDKLKPRLGGKSTMI
jgi:hypothetical protein